MAERSIALVLKTNDAQASVGSNPTSSAINILKHLQALSIYQDNMAMENNHLYQRVVNIWKGRTGKNTSTWSDLMKSPWEVINGQVKQ